MDTTVGDSFFYFFSAVPQVMAAVMALFGVFVIFKVQNLKDDLIGYTRDLANYLRFAADAQDNDTIRRIRENVVDGLNNSIKDRLVRRIINLVNSGIDDVMLQRKYVIDITKRINKVNSYSILLRQLTFLLVCMTAMIIILCIYTLTCSNSIANQVGRQQDLFQAVIFLVILCFVGLIGITYVSFKDTSI